MTPYRGLVRARFQKPGKQLRTYATGSAQRLNSLVFAERSGVKIQCSDLLAPYLPYNRDNRKGNYEQAEIKWNILFC